MKHQMPDVVSGDTDNNQVWWFGLFNNSWVHPSPVVENLPEHPTSSHKQYMDYNKFSIGLQLPTVQFFCHNHHPPLILKQHFNSFVYVIPVFGLYYYGYIMYMIMTFLLATILHSKSIKNVFQFFFTKKRSLNMFSGMGNWRAIWNHPIFRP